MSNKIYEIVDGVESLVDCIGRVRAAQKLFATYTQTEVDKIFLAAASAADKARITLAKMAVEETGMGIVEDKVIKNHYAAEYIYNAYKETKTCGVIEEDKAFGIQKIAEPIGVIAAVIPTTNPTSTAIFKCLLALKTRNAIIISPHPRAKNSTIAAAKLVLEAAVAAGAPEGIIDWIDVPSLEMTNTVMKEADKTPPVVVTVVDKVRTISVKTVAEEIGTGTAEDKATKNYHVVEHTHNVHKEIKIRGATEEDKVPGT